MAQRVAHKRGDPTQGKPVARRPVARNGRRTSEQLEDVRGHGGRAICGGARRARAVAEQTEEKPMRVLQCVGFLYIVGVGFL